MVQMSSLNPSTTHTIPIHGILAKAFADRLAEAFAEYLHQQARFAWGYEQPGDLTTEETREGKALSWHPSRSRLSRPA
jgi:5-methyltetrahydrofolate--homocysteine methyltransferase